jgi:hypothetical protein
MASLYAGLFSPKGGSNPATCQFGPVLGGFVGSILTRLKCRQSVEARHICRHLFSSHLAVFASIFGTVAITRAGSRQTLGPEAMVRLRKPRTRCLAHPCMRMLIDAIAIAD